MKSFTRERIVSAFNSLLFTIVVVMGLVTIGVPRLLLRAPVWTAINLGVFRFVGLILIFIGATIYLWCVWHFVKGRGTPAPVAPPKELVVKGLYRFVRNPMYVGVGVILFGEAIFFESARLLVYAIAVLSGFHLFVLFYEEPTLREKFGESYEQYCKAVPRWLPRIKQSQKLFRKID